MLELFENMLYRWFLSFVFHVNKASCSVNILQNFCQIIIVLTPINKDSQLGLKIVEFNIYCRIWLVWTVLFFIYTHVIM